MSQLAQSSARRVQLHGDLDLSDLPGIRDLTSSSGSMSVLYSGPIHQLLERLSKAEVQELTIAEPDLEEIFLHYYEEGQK